MIICSLKEEKMKHEIKTMTNLSFVGYAIEVSTINGQNFKDIPNFWQTIMQDGRFKKLLSHSDDLGIVGVCYDWRMEQNTFKYMIGVRSHEKHIDDAVHIAFEDMLFASFEAVGKLPDSVQHTTKYIYSTWLPQSTYLHSAGPELEIYPNGDTNSENYVCYYLVPIMQK